MSDQPMTTPAASSTRSQTVTRPRSVLFPLLLIALGLLFLTQTLGYVPWEIWGRLWRFWPVILILIGLDVLIGGRSQIGRYLVGLIAIAAMVGVLLIATLSPYSVANYGLPNLLTRDVKAELGQFEAATIRFTTGAADIELSALERESHLLADGAIQSNRIISQNLHRDDRAGVFELHSTDEGFFGGSTVLTDEWDIMLTQKIPLNLELNFGATEADLDLSSLRVSRFSVDAGASTIDLVVPRIGHTQGSLTTGAAAIDIEIPEGVAANIRIEGGLNAIDIDQSRFPKVGDRFVSPDYETAENRIDLRIDSGVSSISIR